MHTIAFSHSCDLLAILAILHNCQPLTTNTYYLLYVYVYVYVQLVQQT